MKHYDTAQWLQFLRGELPPESQSAMRHHLDSLCHKCTATLELLHQVDAAAKRDSALAVPDNAVRRARSIFALEKPARVQLSSRVLAHLVFDSFREPAMAGIRSSTHAIRQIMYRAGDYTIDVRLEPDVDPAQVVMVGQIVRHSRPLSGSVSVLLEGANRELSRAVTSDFGEFQFVYHPITPLRLLIQVAAESGPIEITFSRGLSRKGKQAKPRPKTKTE